MFSFTPFISTQFCAISLSRPAAPGCRGHGRDGAGQEEVGPPLVLHRKAWPCPRPSRSRTRSLGGLAGTDLADATGRDQGARHVRPKVVTPVGFKGSSPRGIPRCVPTAAGWPGGGG